LLDFGTLVVFCGEERGEIDGKEKEGWEGREKGTNGALGEGG
jgi:hypothetical protein